MLLIESFLPKLEPMSPPSTSGF